MPAPSDLEDVISAIRARIDDATDARTMNRITLTGKPDTWLHKGALVRRTATANEQLRRDRTAAHATDTITVTLTYKLTPANQQESNARAQELSRAIREALSTRSWLVECFSGFGLWLNETEAVQGTWLVIVQTWEFPRFASLGG